MKILLIHQDFLEETDSGGSRFNEMTRIWSEKGHEVTVLAGMIHGFEAEKLPEYRGRLFTRKQHGKVTVWRCYIPESYNYDFTKRLFGYISFVLSSTFAGIFKMRSGIDLILVTSPPLFAGITALILSKIKRTPYVFEVRDLWPESAIDTGVIRNKCIINLAFRFEKYVYKKAALINVLTPAFFKKLNQSKNIPESKLIYIPNAADFQLSDKLLDGFNSFDFRRKNGLEGRFVIVYVGAHGVSNHLIQLIEAAELLIDTNALFLLIGDGMQKTSLINETKERNLSNVRFIDPLPKNEIFKYIIASDIGTSVLKRVETFKTIYSNKTFDYMSCKKPVLMAIDGISRDLVEQAHCGVFAEPEMPEDIAEKIRFCINNPGLLKTLGENGYHYAKENFDRYKLANKYIQHLSKIEK